MTNNVIDGGSAQELFTDGALGGTDWVTFQSTLSSDYNTWWNATDSKSLFVPVPTLWTKVDFPGWQVATGRDVHSSWKDPGNAGSACNLKPGGKSEYWFIMDAFSGYQDVTQGNAVTFTANVVPLGFTGTVTLSSDGPQNIAGVSASWSPQTIT